MVGPRTKTRVFRYLNDTVPMYGFSFMAEVTHLDDLIKGTHPLDYGFARTTPRRVDEIIGARLLWEGGL